MLPVCVQHNRTKKGHVDTFTINPKCVKLGELYGETDPNTFEWTDGLIATATRRFARELTLGTSDDLLRPTSSSTVPVSTGPIHLVPPLGLRGGS